MQDMDFIEPIHHFGDALAQPDGFNVVFWTLMLINVLSIAWVQTAQPGYFKVLFITCVFNRLLYQNLQNDLEVNKPASLFLVLAYVNCFSVVLLELSQAGYPLPVFLLPIGLLGGILLKFGLIKSVQFVSSTKMGSSEHLINHLLFFQAASVILTPLLIGSYFFSPATRIVFVLIAGAILILFILVREFQSLLRSLRLKISPFYIILYLCTLELLPFIVMIHVLISKSGVFN